MTMRDQIIAISDVYGRLTGVGRKRVSTIVLNRGSKLDGIVAGGDLNTGTFERAMQWFSDNWPAGADWPADIPRPQPVMALEAAE
ncbi:hypothetical protein [Shinella sp. M31]|uniref:hypothetical protein n=1 Tax=Shinella sp. M31 TaxID=3368615 RepID=UPI003BA2BC5C